MVFFFSSWKLLKKVVQDPKEKIDEKYVEDYYSVHLKLFYSNCFKT